MIIAKNPTYMVELFTILAFDTVNFEITGYSIHEDKWCCTCLSMKVQTSMSELEIKGVASEYNLMEVEYNEKEISFVIDYERVLIILEDQYEHILPAWDKIHLFNFKSDRTIHLVVYKQFNSNKLHYEFIDYKVHNFFEQKRQNIEKSIVLKKRRNDWKFISSGCNCKRTEILLPEEMSQKELLFELIEYKRKIETEHNVE